MERPISIIWFERCYLGAVAIGLINTALNFGAATAKLADNPATAQMGPGFGSNILIGGAILGLIISALLWYFTARKGSVVAKWIVVVFFALGLIGSLPALATGRGPEGIAGILAIVALVLQAIAVWQLFKLDARVWFGEVKA